MPDIAIVITGGPGAGKSVTIEALSDLLSEAGIEHDALEVEELAWGHPWLALVDTLPQLQLLLAAQRHRGRRLHLIAATTETAEDLDSLVRAISADRALVVALEARPETAARRILNREPEHWVGREGLAAKARELATTIPALPRVDVFITTNRAPLDVARHLRREMEERGHLTPIAHGSPRPQ